MYYTVASPKDKKSLYALWEISFQCSKRFIDLFFDECFPSCRTYIAKEGETVVSAATVISSDYITVEESVKCGYIYGVCTLPAYRRQGISSNILSLAEEESKKRGMDFLYLRPATDELFSFYRKTGYTEPLYHKYAVMPLPDLTETVFSQPLSGKRLERLREKNLKSEFFRTDPAIAGFFASYMNYSKGCIIELENERYVAGIPDDEDPELFRILEIGCEECEKIEYPTLYLAFNVIKRGYPDRQKVKIALPVSSFYSDLHDVKKEVFALAKPLNRACNPEAFFSFSME